MKIFPPAAYIQDTGTSRGRGVFAARAFSPGDVVEVCPAAPFADAKSPIPHELKNRLFNWGYLTGGPPGDAWVLGWGAMYNSANPANMRYEADLASESLRFIAVRDIACDEELTINYSGLGGAAESDNDDWFWRMGIKATGA